MCYLWCGVLQYINHRVYVQFNLRYVSLRKPQRSPRGVQRYTIHQSQQIKIKPFQLRCLSVAWDFRGPRRKPWACCKCIIMKCICLPGHCFALWPRNVLWYTLVQFPTNSSKCSPEQPARSQVDQLVRWPHWHTYYCFLCLSRCYRGRFFLSSFFVAVTGPILHYHDAFRSRGIGGSIRWSTDLSEADVHLGFHRRGPTRVANCHQLLWLKNDRNRRHHSHQSMCWDDRQWLDWIRR